jgi:hypothetical protein
MAIKDSFTKGPQVIRQRRLTAEQKAQLRGATDEVGWNVSRAAAALGNEPVAESERKVAGGTLPGQRKIRKFVGMGKQALDDSRLLVKVGYPTNMGTPHPADVVAFVRDFYPGMEIEATNDRKAGILELVLRTAQMDAGNVPAGTAAEPIDGQRDALSDTEIEGTGKIAQVDAINKGMPCMHCGGHDLSLNEGKAWCETCQAGASYEDGKAALQDASLELELMKGHDAPRLDGKPHPFEPNETVEQTPAPGILQKKTYIAQKENKTEFPAQMKAVPPPDLGADIAPDLEAPIEEPGEDGMHPDSEMTLTDALELLQESTNVVVQKVQEGDAMIGGQEVEPAAEAPPASAPPAGTPFASASPVSARKMAQKDEDPEDVLQRAVDEVKPSGFSSALEKARQRAEQMKKVRTLTDKVTSLPGAQGDPPPPEERKPTPTSDPGTLNKKKYTLSDVPNEGIGDASWQEMAFLDELADTRINSSWDAKKFDKETGQYYTPDTVAPGMRNDLDRPYGYVGPDGKRLFQGIPFLSAQKGLKEKDNTLVSVLPTNIYKKILTPPPSATALEWEQGADNTLRAKGQGGEYIISVDSSAKRPKFVLSFNGKEIGTYGKPNFAQAEATDHYQKQSAGLTGARPFAKWQWQNLTPEERAQARHDMAYANKSMQDRIKRMLQQTPDGAYKEKKKVPSPGDTKPKTKMPRDMDKPPSFAPGKGGVGLKAIPPNVRKKSVMDEIMATDPEAEEYWSQLLGGDLAHEMMEPDKGALEQRVTDMRDISKELSVPVTEEQIKVVTANMRRPRAIGYFAEWVKNGQTAPPMDKMVDMALELSQSDAGLARQLDRLTLKYLMKTSDLMNSMTPDAQRTILLRAIRGDKRIYNTLLRLFQNVAGKEQAPKIAMRIALVASGFNVKPSGQCDDAVKGIKDTDKGKSESNKQPIPGHVRFLCDNPRLEGAYTVLDVTWDPDDCKGRDEDSIRHLLISYAKGLESFKQFIDFGFIGTPHLKNVDTEAGFASIFFRAHKGGDAIPVVEEKE